MLVLNFPTDHPLNHSLQAGALIRDADVILALQVNDIWGTLNRLPRIESCRSSILRSVNSRRHRPASVAPATIGPRAGTGATGTGTATVTLSNDETLISYNISFSGLLGADILAIKHRRQR